MRDLLDVSRLVRVEKKWEGKSVNGKKVKRKKGEIFPSKVKGELRAVKKDVKNEGEKKVRLSASWNKSRKGSKITVPHEKLTT